MIRIVIENILLFLLPTALYVGYVLLTRRGTSTPGTGHQRGAAAVAVHRRCPAASAARLIYFASITPGGKPGQSYTPPVHQGRADRARPSSSSTRHDRLADTVALQLATRPGCSAPRRRPCSLRWRRRGSPPAPSAAPCATRCSAGR